MNSRLKTDVGGLSRLRWQAIMLPFVAIVLVDIVRHTFLQESLHSKTAFAVTYLVFLASASAFAHWIFKAFSKFHAAVATSNARLAALNALAKIAADGEDTDAILAAGLDRVANELQAAAGIVCQVDLSRAEHSAKCYRGFSTDLAHKIQRAKLADDAVALEAVQTGRPVVVENVMDDLRIVEQVKTEGFTSSISAPLKTRNEVTGILAVATRDGHPFSRADVDFIESAGGYLGAMLKNASLLAEAQARTEAQQAILAVGRASSSSLDVQTVLRSSVDSLLDVTGATDADVWLVASDGGLTLRCHRGQHPGAILVPTMYSWGSGLPGRSASSDEILMFTETRGFPRELSADLAHDDLRSVVALPIASDAGPSGVLFAASTSVDAFSVERDLQVLEGVSGWLGMALENGRLHAKVRDVAVLEERGRLSREMHDGMGQLLGYITMQMLTVKRLLSRGDLALAAARLETMEAAVKSMYDDVRAGIMDLNSASAMGGDFLGALRTYVHRFTDTTRLDVELDIPMSELPIAEASQIQLIRIVQEALANVRKHAKATQSLVTFNATTDAITVAIEDDGIGFEPAHLEKTGWPRFGLSTMRERAESVGGTLEVVSTPGKGTRISVALPTTIRGEAHARPAS